MPDPTGRGASFPGPWRETLRTLRERFREDRLGLTAGSLTFTTLISLVPLVTVMLALFSAFPIFAELQLSLNRYLVQSVVPEAIARPVLMAISQFAAKANRLGAVGLLVFIGTAIALMLTIDRALNAIWRVRRARPLTQRVLVYWAAITLGPLLLAASVWLTSTALGLTRGWIDDDLPGPMRDAIAIWLVLAEFAVLAAALAALYRLVPNAPVRWRHAAAGGVLAAAGFVLAKKGLALYLKAVPTYSVVYGAFATLPILLIWIYLVWVVVLLGAVVAAHAPMLLAGVRRRAAVPGGRAMLALESLAWLEAARQADGGGLGRDALAARLRADPLQVESVLDELILLGWVGRLEEAGAPRHVLLCNPDTAPLAPWFDRFLIGPAPGAPALRRGLNAQGLTLGSVLPREIVSPPAPLADGRSGRLARASRWWRGGGQRAR